MEMDPYGEQDMGMGMEYGEEGEEGD